MKYLLLTFLAFFLYGHFTSAQTCDVATGNSQDIGSFCSLAPTGQSSRLELPEGYRFQLIFQEGMKYTDGSGNVPGRNDFAGFVPSDGSSETGLLSVNHEITPGAVSILAVHYNAGSRLWVVDNSRPVDFAGVGETGGNCSGGVTPWGTVLTAEEKYSDSDDNGDGYGDLGWLTEIDPVTATVVNEEKCWALGHMKHENATVMPDERTVYFGEDGGSSGVFKFVADYPRDLSSGRLYGLILDGPLVDREPTTGSGRWVVIPNETIAEQNATTAVATALGVTNFDGVEDVEFHPTTGQIYFAAKGAGRVYRFTDNGEAVRDFMTYVGGRDYKIETTEGTYTEAWGTGNDNLIFDGAGNLWVMQDGDNSYIWVVRAGHSLAEPLVDIFARTPRGSEPTGLNFTPDFRFGFFSIQHPGGENEAQLDAAGNEVRFTASGTVVFALEQYLGDQPETTEDFIQPIPDVNVFPNPTTGEINLDFGSTDAGTGYKLELYDLNGRRLPLDWEHLYVPTGGGTCVVDLSGAVSGSQLVALVIRKGKQRIVRKIWVER